MLSVTNTLILLIVIMLSVIMLSVIMLSVIMLSFIMMSVIMLSVSMPSVIMPSVIMPSVIMPSVIMRSGIMPNVIMLCVVAPFVLPYNHPKSIISHLQKKRSLYIAQRCNSMSSSYFAALRLTLLQALFRIFRNCWARQNKLE